MKIRQMIHQDLAKVSLVHEQSFVRQLNSKQWISCNFNAYPRIKYFVAEEKESIWGYIQWIEKSGFRKDVILELEQIAVLPSKQKQGIGSALITESLKMIKEELHNREASIEHLLVSTRTDNDAQKIYQRVLKAQPEIVIPNLFSADEVLMIVRHPII